jgi:pyridoxal phosphate enzyme (YggS family)
MTPVDVDKLRANLAAVEKRIADACARAGRARTQVTLVAVTKSVSTETAAQLVQLGIRDLGESRPQELWRKAGVLTGNMRWHLIGHLQRNKVERTLPMVEMIHAVDSARLLQAIDEVTARQSRILSVMLEVNASGEASKQGFAPEELDMLVRDLLNLRSVQVRGLMTMAALQDPEACRPTFARLRQLRDDLKSRLSGKHDITSLSMGMSNDFEVAIEEGATHIRLGTVLFEGLA